jgi:protease-4
VKGLRFVIGFLLIATVISVGAMLLLYVVVAQEPDVPAHATLVLSPSGDLPEVQPEFMLGGGGGLTVRGYVELIRKAKGDSRIAGILLKPGGINSPFWAKLQELRGADYIDAEDYVAVSWEKTGVRRQSKIAVINATGVINSGGSGFDPVNGAVVGSDSLVKYIREARADRSIKAIVLRVDSPGGSSTASDVIWRELSISRENNRPVVVSMSDLAASGGYYIALGGDAIVAQPGTLTGSIGVYTGKFVTTGTLDKLGANIEATSSGKHAEIYSPDRRFTPEERQKIEESMQNVYDQFIERTAAARHMTPEKVDEVAQGRVWTGEQAKQLGLVDELGGLYKAIDLAKQRARISADEEVDLVVYPPHRSFYEVIADQLSGPVGRVRSAYTADALLQLLGPRERAAAAALLAPARLFRSGQVLAHMPYVFVR